MTRLLVLAMILLGACTASTHDLPPPPPMPYAPAPPVRHYAVPHHDATAAGRAALRAAFDYMSAPSADPAVMRQITPLVRCVEATQDDRRRHVAAVKALADFMAAHPLPTGGDPPH
jgi:hypothetical protein